MSTFTSLSSCMQAHFELIEVFFSKQNAKGLLEACRMKLELRLEHKSLDCNEITKTDLVEVVFVTG